MTKKFGAFRIQFGGAFREDLRNRLAHARWSDAVTDDWQYGMKQSFLQTLCNYWHTDYDFDAAEDRLNSLPHTRFSIKGFGVSCIHLKGTGKKPTPLLLMNSWPSSFVEYNKLAYRLADPAAYGDPEAKAFDVIIPTLPGFGYSDRPTQPNQVNTEDLFHSLMTEELGYSHYFASGTDIGAGVATRLALKFPESLLGIHIATVVDPPKGTLSSPLTPAEVSYQRSSAEWLSTEGAYEHVHYTRPQTLAFGLADSPGGLASWIVDKFHSWTDHNEDLFQVFPPDTLIDNLMVYWATGTIGSSMRYYYDTIHFRAPLTPMDRVSVPTAVCMWPKDLVVAPKEWAERVYNVQQYSVQLRGGHFPAWEAPEAYASDLRSFTSSIDENL